MFRLTETAGGDISVDVLWTAAVMRQTYVVPVYYAVPAGDGRVFLKTHPDESTTATSMA